MKKLLLFALPLFLSANLYGQFKLRQVLTVEKGQGLNPYYLDVDDSILVSSSGYDDRAFVFENNNGLWEQKQMLQSESTNSNSSFGGLVTVSGTTIAVEDNNFSEEGGAVYFFEREGNEWVKMTLIQTNLSWWGSRNLHVKGDLATAVQNTPTRQLYLMKRQEDKTWKLSDTLNTEFPYYSWGIKGYLSDSLIITGGRIRMVSPLNFWRKDIDGNWEYSADVKPENEEGVEYFGSSVASNGTTIVAGAHYSEVTYQGSTVNDAGLAFIFEKVDGQWVQVKRISADIPTRGATFGRSVAIEGNKIVISAPNESFDADNKDSLYQAGAVYVYEKVNSEWKQTQKLTAFNRKKRGKFGMDVELDNNRIFVTESDNIYIFGESPDCEGTENGNAFYDYCNSCANGLTGGEPVLSPNQECVITGDLESIKKETLSIYPNPFTKNGFNFMVSGKEVELISISDSKGNIIQTYQAIPKNIGTNLTSGIYFVQVYFSDGTTANRKVVKQ